MMRVMLSITILILGSAVGIVGAKTIYVPDDYPKIQWAINNATDGDVIVVNSGTYYEHGITINKSITLIGIDHPIINATYTGNGVRILADNVVFEGFVIKSCGNTMGWSYGVLVDGENITIKDCVLYDIEEAGILIYGNNTKITNNTIHQAHWGVLLFSSNNTMVNNTIFNCDDAGIIIGSIYSRNNEISYNRIYNIKGAYGGALFLDPASYTKVHHNVITNSKIGMVLHGSTYNVIYLNRIENNDFALEVTSISMNNTFYRNCFINNTDLRYTPNWTNWSGPNYWNTSVGNFWSDYKGTDTDGDGIGDEPYIINSSSGNIDYRPLMACPVFIGKGDINGDAVLNMDDVINLAWMLFGNVPQNKKADLNGNGIIDIGDLAKLVYYLLGKVDEI